MSNLIPLTITSEQKSDEERDAAYENRNKPIALPKSTQTHFNGGHASREVIQRIRKVQDKQGVYWLAHICEAWVDFHDFASMDANLVDRIREIVVDGPDGEMAILTPISWMEWYQKEKVNCIRIDHVIFLAVKQN